MYDPRDLSSTVTPDMEWVQKKAAEVRYNDLSRLSRTVAHIDQANTYVRHVGDLLKTAIHLGSGLENRKLRSEVEEALKELQIAIDDSVYRFYNKKFFDELYERTAKSDEYEEMVL